MTKIRFIKYFTFAFVFLVLTLLNVRSYTKSLAMSDVAMSLESQIEKYAVENAKIEDRLSSSLNVIEMSEVARLHGMQNDKTLRITFGAQTASR